jgi:hypothetical protein
MLQHNNPIDGHAVMLKHNLQPRGLGLVVMATSTVRDDNCRGGNLTYAADEMRGCVENMLE